MPQAEIYALGRDGCGATDLNSVSLVNISLNTHTHTEVLEASLCLARVESTHEMATECTLQKQTHICTHTHREGKRTSKRHRCDISASVMSTMSLSYLLPIYIYIYTYIYIYIYSNGRIYALIFFLHPWTAKGSKRRKCGAGGGGTQQL